MRLTVYNYRNNGQHRMYGYVDTTTRGIEMLNVNEPLYIKNEKGKVTGSLVFNKFEMDMRPSLLDYLSQGW